MQHPIREPMQLDNTWSIATGQWNSQTTEGAEACLTGSRWLRITGLEVKAASEHSLSIQVRLAGSAEVDEGSKEVLHPARHLPLLNLVFTLTATNGAQVGGMEVTISRKARGLTVEMPLPARLRGTYRLKAALCAGETVLDNARTEVVL